jgi:galactonate dehydratase
VANGFTAFKTGPLHANWREVLWGDALEQGRQDMAALRELVGPDAEIGLDAHAQQLEPSTALQLANMMAEYNPWFIEEPLRMENRHAVAELRRKMPVPLATGECLYTKFEFDELIRAGAVDIVQPDICICGGMTEMRKIAAISEAHGVVVAPHNPVGPLATVVNIHFAAAISNFLVLEYSPHNKTEMSMIEGALTPVDGFFEIPDIPGWGVDIVDDVIQSHPYRGAWHRPDRVNPDGSVAYI